ncbi:fibronectin type III-like domain-contianing protein [Pseudofrankia saprophytica]|uniref:fibronectin type III-like domain-contianing protein n=1 Tax=Pseudofrankia saprophytica TaxID=298655 RepID=UPI003CC90D10
MRVRLEAGQSATVRFVIGPAQLGIWDSRMEHTVGAGTVDVMVGPNAADTHSVELKVLP